MMTISAANWRKSTHSAGGNGGCVETANARSGAILVRDTTSRGGGTLAFSATAWRAFTSGLKRGLTRT